MSAQETSNWPVTGQTQGQATLRFIGILVYDAQLQVMPGFDPLDYAHSPLTLTLTYRRALAGEDIAKRSLHEMSRSGALTADQTQRWMAFMQQAIPNVVAGDKLVGRWWPQRRLTRIERPGISAHTLEDAEFGPRFFGIWLGPETSQPEMRKRLLGLPG